METPKKMEKKLETIGEILEDQYFKQILQKNITELRLKRNTRPSPPAGSYYKKDWFDRMESQGTFSEKYFLSNIWAIWNKTSSLNSETRNVILFVCNKALQETYLKYAQEKKEPGTTQNRATGDGPTQAKENQQLGGHHGC